MIYIATLDRYWNPGSEIVSDPKALKAFHQFMALEYIRLFQLAIDTQRYKGRWKELTPGYLKFKRDHGLSTNMWEATGQLRRSIRIFFRGGSTLVIGFDKRIVHKGSHTKLYKIAQYLEYGTIRMPPRPLFRFIYFYMSRHVRYFWGKFLRSEGLE